MRFPALLVSLLVLLGASSARGQTVIVPETPYGGSVSLTAQSTAMLDHDSVLMASTLQSGVLGRTEFLVVNIETGAIELQPVLLPAGMIVSSVAVLSPVSGLIVVRDDNNFQSRGKYFVVNPLTGAIVRGPVPFTTGDTGWEYRIAVVDPSTVLIAHRSDIGSAGVFTVVDPQTGTVKVAETPFTSGQTNTMAVALLDPHRVAIAYGTPGPDFRMSFTVVDPQDGAVARPPQELAQGGPFALIARSPGELVLGYFDSAIDAARFVTLDPVTGARGSATTFATGPLFTPSVALLGDRSLFIAWSYLGPAQYAVFDIDGTQVVPPTPFNGTGYAVFISSVSSVCRTLISYQDSSDNQKGKFQVIDFSGVCTPPPCPANITDDLDVFQSFFVPFFVPELQLQLVLVRSRTNQPIAGPFSLVAEGLQNATMLGSRTTACSATGPAPSVRLSAGPDDTLSPGEYGGAFLLFLKTAAGPITYTPRILNGIPQR